MRQICSRTDYCMVQHKNQTRVCYKVIQRIGHFKDKTRSIIDHKYNGFSIDGMNYFRKNNVILNIIHGRILEENDSTQLKKFLHFLVELTEIKYLHTY